MGAAIYGWVETREDRGEWWDAAVRIHDIVPYNYGMYASLFGVRNDDGSGSHHTGVTPIGYFRAIAPGRGVPPGASTFYHAEHDDSSAVGETWLTWSELAAIDWDEWSEEWSSSFRDFLTGGWATLFKMMALLAEQFGPDNVRLSVWFDEW